MKHFFCFLTPFLLIISVNECLRYSNQPNFKKSQFSVLNSSELMANKCSWICHDNTNYCKTYHLSYSKTTISYTDPYYFGVIDVLKSTGNYKLANIVLFVFIMPIWIFFFLIKCVHLIHKIKPKK
jgi:hypothetical protein